MEPVMIIITVLSIIFSWLLPHCSASLQLPLMKPPLHYHVKAQHLSLPPFPRKLMSTEQEVEVHEAILDASNKNDKENFSGKKEEEKEQKMKVVMKKKGGKKQEWVEGEDPSQYSTMDYSRVRRRRPIHNKNIPVAP